MSKESLGVKIKNSTRRVWGIFSTTAMDWTRSGPALFFTFIYPIVMILLFGYIFSAGTDDSLYTLHYMNEDVYQIGDQVYSYNPANILLKNLGLDNETIGDALNLRLVKTDQANTTLLVDWMKSNDIPYLFNIPAGWSAAVNESKINATAPSANIEYYYDPSHVSSFEVQSIIGNVLQEMNLQEFGIPSMLGVEVTTTPEREGLDYIDFYVPGIIMVTISTSGMMGLVSIATSERLTGYTFKLAASPIKKWEWATGHLLWQAIMGIIVAILTVLTGWIAFDFNMATIHPMMIPILIFGSMTFGGIALILARFVKRPEAAMAATMSYVFPQMFLAGAIFPLESLPNYMQIIAQAFPLYYISEALRSTMLESTFNNVWLPFGITIAMGVVFFAVGSIITVWRKE
jgi:ABC-2 type transport system permease protein